ARGERADDPARRGRAAEVRAAGAAGSLPALAGAASVAARLAALAAQVAGEAAGELPGARGRGLRAGERRAVHAGRGVLRVLPGARDELQRRQRARARAPPGP